MVLRSKNGISPYSLSAAHRIKFRKHQRRSCRNSLSTFISRLKSTHSTAQIFAPVQLRFKIPGDRHTHVMDVPRTKNWYQLVGEYINNVVGLNENITSITYQGHDLRSMRVHDFSKMFSPAIVHTSESASEWDPVLIKPSINAKLNNGYVIQFSKFADNIAKYTTNLINTSDKDRKLELLVDNRRSMLHNINTMLNNGVVYELNLKDHPEHQVKFFKEHGITHNNQMMYDLASSIMEVTEGISRKMINGDFKKIKHGKKSLLNRLRYKMGKIIKTFKDNYTNTTVRTGNHYGYKYHKPMYKKGYYGHSKFPWIHIFSPGYKKPSKHTSKFNLLKYVTRFNKYNSSSDTSSSSTNSSSTSSRSSSSKSSTSSSSGSSSSSSSDSSSSSSSSCSGSGSSHEKRYSYAKSKKYKSDTYKPEPEPRPKYEHEYAYKNSPYYKPKEEIKQPEVKTGRTDQSFKNNPFGAIGSNTKSSISIKKKPPRVYTQPEAKTEGTDHLFKNNLFGAIGSNTKPSISMKKKQPRVYTQPQQVYTQPPKRKSLFGGIGEEITVNKNKPTTPRSEPLPRLNSEKTISETIQQKLKYGSRISGNYLSDTGVNNLTNVGLLLDLYYNKINPLAVKPKVILAPTDRVLDNKIMGIISKSKRISSVISGIVKSYIIKGISVLPGSKDCVLTAENGIKIIAKEHIQGKVLLELKHPNSFKAGIKVSSTAKEVCKINNGGSVYTHQWLIPSLAHKISN